MTEKLLSTAFLFALFLGLSACDRPVPGDSQAEAPAVSTTQDVATQSENRRVILVTGATGTQGGAVARELLDRGYAVRGLTRDPESAAARALAELGADMVQGDFDDTPSLQAAMDGIDGLFLVTLFWNVGYEREVEQGKRLIDLAQEQEVPFLVLTSVAGADAGSGIPHFESKWEVEQYLHASGLDWSIVRPVEFMDNWRWSAEAFASGRLADPRDPDSSHQWIAARDIGFFVGEAFDNPGKWSGKTLEIAGDELTLRELQSALEQAYGHEFRYIRTPWETFEVQAGEELASMYRWFEEQGYAVDVEGLRSRYPGLTTVAEYLAELAAQSP